MNRRREFQERFQIGGRSRNIRNSTDTGKNKIYDFNYKLKIVTKNLHLSDIKWFTVILTSV